MDQQTFDAINPPIFRPRLTPDLEGVLSGIFDNARRLYGDDAFRMEEGDGGEGGDGGSGDGGEGDGGSGDGGSGDGGEGGDGAEKIDLSKLPDDVQKLVKRYRKEAAEASGKARDEAKTKAAKEAQDALMADIGKKLGFIKDDDKKMTPEEFAAKLSEESSKTTAAQAAARETAVELAVYRTASKAGGDPEALLDSRAFLQKVAKLDVSKADFTDKLKAEITKAVEENPKLKLQAGAGSSSVDHGSGGTGDNGERKSQGLAGAVGSHYGV